MKKLLFLDDIRDPNTQNWLTFSPIKRPFEVHWVKNYKEFTEWIIQNGLPDGIMFDHDLADFHYEINWSEISTDLQEVLYNEDHEKTGYDCAKWLVEYCINNNLKIPPYYVHSGNTVGKENIEKYLENYKKANDSST